MPRVYASTGSFGRGRQRCLPFFHREHLSLKRLTPENAHELLFDDVLWVKKARQEHDVFVDQMRSRGIEVLLVGDLLTETLTDPEARMWLLDRKVTPLRSGREPAAYHQGGHGCDTGRLKLYESLLLCEGMPSCAGGNQ